MEKILFADCPIFFSPSGAGSQGAGAPPPYSKTIPSLYPLYTKSYWCKNWDTFKVLKACCLCIFVILVQ